jgi:hypothetical protein
MLAGCNCAQRSTVPPAAVISLAPIERGARCWRATLSNTLYYQPPKESSQMANECSAVVHRGREARCSNGFPMNAGCVGIVGAVPYCCNEAFCGRLWPDTGAPDRCEVFTHSANPKEKT